MGKILGLVIGGIVIVGGAWWFLDRPDDASKMMIEKDTIVQEEEKMAPKNEMQKSDVPVEDKMMEKTESTTIPEKKVSETDGAMMAQGAYVEIGPNVLEGSKATKRVLFFYASWCPLCKPADAEFRDRMSEIPEGVTVIRVNYNDPSTDQAEKDLAAKYGVTYQHTFVQIDGQGNVVTKWNGGKIAELLKNIK